MKCRNRNKKVSAYDGISEFALSMVYYFQHVNIVAYDKIRPDGWRTKRQAMKILNISKDGLETRITSYRSYRLCIDTDRNSKMITDGVDFS